MKCPVCVETDLVMSERQNVEIDYCPKCRGVWLDRGELDKIIERSATEAPPAPAPAAAPQPTYGYEPRGKHHGGGKHGGYRRKSWLQEIFD
ncbi:zf-TFIIB domain-containing protein [Thalassobaculum sp.]|uniref:TFIIB-type zinc ribbon-containing protein n=1 Tax=Thalassobaculum sp. TaxID=2022740 RepID=UPI0032F08DE2